MRKARIFIVEDEIVIIRGLQQALENLHYAICGFALSGEEALEVVERKKPDLMLVDVFLRGKMNGIELAQQVRSNFDIPVIYITAYSNEEVLQKAKLTDPFGYIVKPFRESQLKVNIELALERHRVEKTRQQGINNYLTTIQELESILRERTEELDKVSTQLNRAQQVIESKRMKLDEFRRESLEINQALSVLTRKVEKNREEMELEVSAAIRGRILPLLRQLGSDPAFQKYRTDIEMLFFHMRQLSSNLANENTWCAALSTTELRIATLIKNGSGSGEIAQQLHISLDTVKTHRRNIRKKLNLLNSETNLAAYLMAH